MSRSTARHRRRRAASGRGWESRRPCRGGFATACGMGPSWPAAANRGPGPVWDAPDAAEHAVSASAMTSARSALRAAAPGRSLATPPCHLGLHLVKSTGAPGGRKLAASDRTGMAHLISPARPDSGTGVAGSGTGARDQQRRVSGHAPARLADQRGWPIMTTTATRNSTATANAPRCTTRQALRNWPSSPAAHQAAISSGGEPRLDPPFRGPAPGRDHSGRRTQHPRPIHGQGCETAERSPPKSRAAPSTGVSSMTTLGPVRARAEITTQIGSSARFGDGPRAPCVGARGSHGAETDYCAQHVQDHQHVVARPRHTDGPLAGLFMAIL